MGGGAAEERLPLLGSHPVAEKVRLTALTYMLCASYILASFWSMREVYTTQVLRASDPVATATYAVVAYFVGHALTSPIFGKLSDGTGRKPIMLLGVSTTCCVYAIMATITNVYVFVLVFFVLGLLDMSTSMVYLMLVDTSNEPLSPGIVGWAARAAGLNDESRDAVDKPVERRIGLLFSFCWGVGLLGSVLGVGGSLLTYAAVGVRATIGVCALLALLLLLRIVLSLPETVDPREESLFDLAREALNEQAAGAATLFQSSRRCALLLAGFLQHASTAGSFSLLAYWVVFKFGFGLGLQAVGILIAIVSVATGIAALQFWLVPMLARTGISERSAERGCVIVVVASLPMWLLLSFAFEPWMALLGITALASTAIFPELRALISADLPISQQGFVQGALATINSLADIAGACVGIFLYEHAVDDDIPHDSHRSRTSFKANAVWQLIFMMEVIVTIIINNTPPASLSDAADFDGGKAKPIEADPNLT